jgi:hypothetical protein
MLEEDCTLKVTDSAGHITLSPSELETATSGVEASAVNRTTSLETADVIVKQV